MLFTTHLLVGAVAGRFAPNPIAAFVVGAASHFLLDSVPHWAVATDRATWLAVAALDGVLAIVVGVAATRAAATRRWCLIAGMAGAGLPDLDKPLTLVLGYDPTPLAIAAVHRGVQHESMALWWVDLSVATAAALVVIAAALRARSRRVAVARP